MKSNSHRATTLRALIGGCTGTVTACLAFVVLHYLFFDAEAIRRGAPLDWNPAMLLGVVCCGASVGAILAAFFGKVEILGTTKHIVLSVLGGAGIVASMGLVSAQYHPLESFEARQVAWLIYGVPIGAVMGGIAGGIYSYFNSILKAKTDAANKESVAKSSLRSDQPGG
jgi:MFS family permease